MRSDEIHEPLVESSAIVNVEGERNEYCPIAFE